MIDAEILRHTLMHAPVGICILSGPEHIFGLVNEAFMTLLFDQPRPLVGLPFREALPELAAHEFYQRLDHAYSTGETSHDQQYGQETHLEWQLSDGTTKSSIIHFTIELCRDPQDRPVGLLVYLHDVTESVTRRKQLQENVTLLRMITDRLPAFVSYMDTDRRYRFVNSIYASWFGLPRSEIEGKTRKELVNNPTTYDYMQPFESQAFAGEPVSFELTLNRPDGRYVNLDTEYLPDVDPRTGEVRGIIGVGQDVTERKKALLAIEASESRFRSLTDMIPQLMWTSTADGHVNYANERCLEYTGLATYQKYGDGWVTTIHPEDLPLVGEAWHRSMAAGIAFKEEYRIRRFDGEYRWFLGRAIPIKDGEGMIQYWIGTATDIEDQKNSAAELRSAKEAAETANATKSAFLANMSHEIRTPLGAILGFSSLLKDPAITPEERHQYVDTINRNGQSLTRIIDDILDLAKVEAGRLDVEEIDFSFGELLKEVIDLFKEKAQQKKIELTWQIDEKVPEYISSDPTRLRQILINIIGNAVKFTEKGGVYIRVRSRRDESTRAVRMSVEVRDTGCGLDLEQKERLFKPFTQADNTTTRRFGGTGLGLALSRRLSEALGGDIHVAEFKPQEGCTFVVNFLARAARHRDPSVTASLAALSGERKINKPLLDVKILLVDDSIDNQFLVKHLLMRNGAEVEVASNGREAVEKAMAEEFDIVLMDIQMPEMDGHQATVALLARGYQVPIIALTAHAMIEERVKTQASGFTGHLTKPLNKEELLQTIAQHAVKLNKEKKS